MRAIDGSGRGRAGSVWWVAAWLGCAGAGAAAQPAPVLEGIWDVRSLVTYERRDAAASLATPPPRARSYRICIGPERALSPMLPPELPPSAELIFDGSSYTGSFDEPASGLRQVDMGYRRLSATAFEGWHEIVEGSLIARAQFDAQYGGPICGATQPGSPADSGEP